MLSWALILSPAPTDPAPFSNSDSPKQKPIVTAGAHTDKKQAREWVEPQDSKGETEGAMLSHIGFHHIPHYLKKL